MHVHFEETDLLGCMNVRSMLHDLLGNNINCAIRIVILFFRIYVCEAMFATNIWIIRPIYHCG